MRRGRRAQAGDCLQSNVQRAVDANRDVASSKVIVDRRGNSVDCDSFAGKSQGASLRAVSANDAQPLDASRPDGIGGAGSAFGRLELKASIAFEHRPAELDDPSHVARGKRNKVTRNQARVASTHT